MSGVDRFRDVAETKLDVFASAQLGFESLAGARNGVALIVKESLDAEGHFDVATAKEPLTGASFVRPELGKLAFPEAQNVRRDFAKLCDFADAEVEFVRNLARSRGAGALAGWLLRCHMPNSIGQRVGHVRKIQGIS